MLPNLSGTLSGQFVWLCRRGTGQPLAVRYMYRTKLEEARVYLQRKGVTFYCSGSMLSERIASGRHGPPNEKADPLRAGFSSQLG